MIFWTFFFLIPFFAFGDYSFGKLSKPKALEILGVFLIILLSAIRFDVGWDYQGYFSALFPYPDIETFERFEPGSELIFIIANYLQYPPTAFILFSIFTYIVVFHALIKYTKNPLVAIVVYISFFYLNSLGVIRQGLAVAIIIEAIHFLLEKKYIKYIALVMIACLFHSSAIITILFVLIFKIVNKKTIIPFIVISFVFISLSFKIITDKLLPFYSSYILNSSEYQGGSLMRLFMLLLNIILLCRCFKYKSINNYRLSAICCIGTIFPFILGSHIGNRIAEYFYLCLVYLIPALMINLKNQFRNLSLLIFYSYFMITVIVDAQNPVKSALTPYKTIINVDLHNPKWK